MDVARLSTSARTSGLAAASLLLVLGATELAAQSAVPLSREIWLSDGAAGIELELEASPSPLRISLTDGRVEIAGTQVASYSPGGLLDRAWRTLLGEATATSDARIAQLLVDWTPPSGLGEAARGVAAQIDASMESAFAGLSLEAAAMEAEANAAVAQLQGVAQNAVAAQEAAVQELEQRVQDLEADLRRSRAREASSRSRARSRGPWSNITGGLQGLLATFVTFLILAGGGWLAVRALPSRFEAASVAIRRRPLAVFGAGLAGWFLAIPVFVVGVVGLAVSIVGLLAIPFWVVGYPLLIFGMAVFGYLVFARVLGEWVSDRANGNARGLSGTSPFGFLIAGLMVILSFGAAAAVIGMLGSWMNWLEAILLGLGSVFTTLAGIMGFGALLITRGGRWAYAGAGDDSTGWEEVDVAWDADLAPEGDPTGTEDGDAQSEDGDEDSADRDPEEADQDEDDGGDDPPEGSGGRTGRR